MNLLLPHKKKRQTPHIIIDKLFNALNSSESVFNSENLNFLILLLYQAYNLYRP